MGSDGSPSSRAESRNNIDHTRWEACLEGKPGDLKSACCSGSLDKGNSQFPNSDLGHSLGHELPNRDF